MNIMQNITPVRMEQDSRSLLYITMWLLLMFTLFMVVPIVIYGIWLLFYLAGAAIIIGISIGIERKFLINRLHLALFSPILIGFGLLYISAALTMWAGGRMHGVWLFLVILGAMHILIFNALISYFLDTDTAIDFMRKTGRIGISEGRYYFLMPDFAKKQVGLPDEVMTAVWVGRAIFLVVCAYGAIVFGPGLYSSVGAYERLLNGAGTIQLGMGVLGARLWHFPLALAIQRKFERLPADEKYLKVE
ncbi:hypothetical protein Q0601_09110 [Paracoccus onubensis]|uniref:hypothetical protein n=1 Tax=Paracoccus onubensis TaxID=1675788 RepID=UPI00272EFFD6|nr:hypothetical protein [Paracoccus onubensis]MDP0927326.1 hypothetical protein [Paracoccus onubensis]